MTLLSGHGSAALDTILLDFNCYEHNYYVALCV